MMEGSEISGIIDQGQFKALSDAATFLVRENNAEAPVVRCTECSKSMTENGLIGVGEQTVSFDPKRHQRTVQPD